MHYIKFSKSILVYRSIRLLCIDLHQWNVFIYIQYKNINIEITMSASFVKVNNKTRIYLILQLTSVYFSSPKPKAHRRAYNIHYGSGVCSSLNNTIMFSFILFRRNLIYLLSGLHYFGSQKYYLELPTLMMYMFICLNISI